MTETEVIQTIERGQIIAILRGDFMQREFEVVSILEQAGITAVEMTLNSPGAFDGISRLARHFGSRIAIGAGTVVRVDQVNSVADVGASFIVSPNRNLAVIQATKHRGMISIPGCFTPSEILEAMDAGADAAKLFPAGSLGPGFVKAIRGPIPDVRLVPTGGVDPESAPKYLASGAWALGVGSELAGPDAVAPGGLERLLSRAAAFVAVVRRQ